MSSGNFGERFFFNREPGWHGLGKVSDKPTSASDAFEGMSPFDIKLMPVSVDIGRGYVATDYQSITRTPVPDDPRHRVFGLVKSQYVILPPAELCKIYDEVVGQPIETMGSINKGITFFFTVELPSVSIKGDEVRQFIVICPTYDGNTALPVIVCSVRVVCENTLMVAKSQAKVSYRIIHKAGVAEEFRKTIDHVYREGINRALAQKETFERMSSTRLTIKQVTKILEKVYRMPDEPEAYRISGVTLNQLKCHQRNIEKVETSRVNALSLFLGEGTGLNDAACAGNAWGLYNAICEWENYKRYRSIESRGTQILMGKRAKTMGQAYAILGDKKYISSINV